MHGNCSLSDLDASFIGSSSHYIFGSAVVNEGRNAHGVVHMDMLVIRIRNE